MASEMDQRSRALLIVLGSVSATGQAQQESMHEARQA